MTRSARLLIVDDEPGTLRVLASVLEAADFEVETASNGRVALERMEANAFDVVLLDYLMPQLDGCETLNAIRKSRKHAGVRVVIMSGVAESMIRRRCKGFDAFLWKPFGLDELTKLMRSLVAKKTASRKTAR